MGSILALLKLFGTRDTLVDRSLYNAEFSDSILCEHADEKRNYYTCLVCGYEGPCYGTLVGDKVSAVWCLRCGCSNLHKGILELPCVIRNPTGDILMCSDSTMHPLTPLTTIEKLWLKINLTTLAELNTKHREDLDCKQR